MVDKEDKASTVGRGHSTSGFVGWDEDCGFSSKCNGKLVFKFLN